MYSSRRSWRQSACALQGVPVLRIRLAVPPPCATNQSPSPTPAADAVAKQLRIRLVPDLVDLGGEKLSVVGEYRLPLKMVLPSGDRVTLDLTVAST